MPFWDDDGTTNSGWASGVKTAQPSPLAAGFPQAMLTAAGAGDNFDPEKASNAVYWTQHAKDQAAYTAKHAMTRDDFLKKYGKTFVADDKGGNAASEVAGGDVGAYYDRYLAPGAKQTMTVSHGDDSEPTEDAINWGEGKYQDAHPYFDAYDNVNPHPQSQRGNGFEEAWRQIGRPIATGALMYAGVGALGGTVLGGGAATGATSASGLAGYLGMDAGYGATALNAGALNTGMSLARGNNIGDALKSGLTSAFLSPISTYVGDASGGGIVGKIVGSTVSGGVQGAVNGQGFGKGLGTGLVNGVAGAAGNYVGGIIGSSTGMDSLANVGGSVVSSVIKGSDPLKALISSGANAAASEITGNIDGFSDLSPDQQSFINSVVSSSLKGKTPTKSLIDGVTHLATRQVSKSKPTTNTTTGGWSA